MVLLRGGGDLATGVAYRLHQAGFAIIVLELPWPLSVRRRVALSTAVHEDEIHIEGLVGRLVHGFMEAGNVAASGIIPVLVSPELPDGQQAAPGLYGGDARESGTYTILIDARMAKKNIDTDIEQADTVIGLGPGFNAGIDCHAVVETMRGHHLGRVIWQGQAQPNTGIPGVVGGKGADRVLRASIDGIVQWRSDIGTVVQAGDVIGTVEGQAVRAPFDGVVRGLIAPGTRVEAGQKIGDVDSRSDVSACFTISDKALAIGGGVLEAILHRIVVPEWKKT